MHTPAPNRLYLRGGWIAIALAVLVWTSTFFLLYLPGNRELGQIGPLGDWVAGLTAPFLSIAGFFMIYAAFRQQSTGTATARQEFLLQRFETVFFQLVQLYHQNAQTIQDSYGKQVQEDFFEAAHRFLKKHLNQRGDLESLQRIYASFYEQHYNRIDHFVRHLLFCIHFVHHSNAFDSLGDQEAHAERDHYLRILQAQLSTEELVLLFYHSLCDPTGYQRAFVRY